MQNTVETVVFLSNKNAKPTDYVEIGVDTEDYYKIKDSRKKIYEIILGSISLALFRKKT